ncbi:MAG: trigger factor [Chlamydiales bacterium]|nr:trigger factor [Chlamydiales bacterium]
MTKQKEIQLGQDVEFEIHTQPHCVVEMQVTAKEPLVKKSFQEAVHSVAKQVSIPGFRKGKAPTELIQKRYPEALEQQWHKAIADHAFRAAQHVARIPVLTTKAPITFNMSSCEMDKAEMKFSFEREPEVPEIDISKIHLEIPPKENISEEAIDEAVRQASFFFAEWTTITDRPAQEKDYVILDIFVLDGEKEQKVFNGTRFEVSEKSMSSWMRELVIGMSTNEKKEGISKPDDDATEDEKKEFEPKNVRVELVKIEEAKLPEQDDVFAAKVGCKTMDEMRANIRLLFESKNEENRISSLRDQLSEELIKTHPFDLPKSLLDEEIKYRMESAMQHPRFKQEWEKKTEEERKEHESKLRTTAENAVRLFYLCRKVAQDANISLSKEELKKSDASFLELLIGLRSPYEQQHNEEQQAMEMTRLMLHKAQEHIIKQIENIAK